VLVLIVTGLLAGVITALSPCVLPVLPIVLAGGATGGPRRPYAVIAGLVASFTVFTLAAAALLSALHLPDDLLRDLAIALLFIVAATLVSRRVADLVARPFAVLTRRRFGGESGGFLLGVGLGLVFVPCAGPVLATVSVLAANREVGVDAVFLTLAYAVGAALPLLAVALGGRRVSRALASRMAVLRPALAVVVAATATAIAFGADRRLQTFVPGYTEALQERIERSDAAERELARLNDVERVADREGELEDFGQAPEVAGSGVWLNTPGGGALTLASLRGRVVVLDFWTYSCINCLRTLPYLKAWDSSYRKDGLTILGVHTPEFAFERKAANVRGAVRDLGIRYPVALDNNFGTWNAWGNRYWPAKYLIDRRGHVRYAHFGEGEYDRTEQVIRQLLGEDVGSATVAVRGANSPSREPITPETYLGHERLDRYLGSEIVRDRETDYRLPTRTLPASTLAYGGRVRVEAERIVAGRGASLRLSFRARDVHLVLGGRGRVEVLVDGKALRPVAVRGDRLYTLVRGARVRDGRLELRFSPGVSAYAFTFG